MFSMLSLFLNWQILALVVAVIVLCVAVYFLAGPQKLLTLISDIRFWAAIAVVAMLLIWDHTAKKIEDQARTIQNQQIDLVTAHDAQGTTAKVGDLKGQNTKQSDQMQTVINTAKPGDELDALLDEISHERCSVDPAMRPADCVRNDGSPSKS